jgi:ribosomal protein S18 acetylase RimI-like enzyme
MKEFILPKTGETARIEVLGAADLTAVMALQDATRSALPPEQKMFVLPQSAAYFQNLLVRQNGLMLGVRQKGELISQMVVMGAMTLSDVVDQQKLTRNDILFHHALPSETIVMAKSMAVHPDWRGNELSPNMLRAMLELPLTRSADHIFAQISVENTRSWELFLRYGFGIVAAGIDPGDQKPRFIVQRPTFGFAYTPGCIADDVDPVSDFAAIVRLTQREKLIGTLEQGANLTLAFHNNAEVPSVLADLPAVTL